MSSVLRSGYLAQPGNVLANSRQRSSLSALLKQGRGQEQRCLFCLLCAPVEKNLLTIGFLSL